MRTVHCRLNGQSRNIQVRDRSVEVRASQAEKADPDNPAHVAAPFAGAVTVRVKPGETVDRGGRVATIEAMKMEAAITTPTGGVVRRVLIDGTGQVNGGDLIVEFERD